jgi:hypothetical protein
LAERSGSRNHRDYHTSAERPGVGDCAKFRSRQLHSGYARGGKDHRDRPGGNVLSSVAVGAADNQDPEFSLDLDWKRCYKTPHAVFPQNAGSDLVSRGHYRQWPSAEDVGFPGIVSHTKRSPVESSATAAVVYSKRLHALEIAFRNGAIYCYLKVPSPVLLSIHERTIESAVLSQ